MPRVMQRALRSPWLGPLLTVVWLLAALIPLASLSLAPRPPASAQLVLLCLVLGTFGICVALVVVARLELLRARAARSQLEQENLALKELIRRNATEHRCAEAALSLAKSAAEAASEAKSAFLANMSHEIRTPMNAVIGLTNLLLDTQLHQQQRELLVTVRQSSESLLELLNEILDYSKLEANKIELDVSPFDVRALLDTTFDLFGAQFAKKRLDFVVRVADDVPAYLLADVARYRQIVLNLVSNALKFTIQGEVEISVKHDLLGSLLLVVRDTGIGIEADKLTALFRPFTQLDGSTTRRFGGSGLGLAICKRFAELMGGKLWAESVVGQGTTFQFECSLPKSSRAPSGPTRAPRFALRGQRVLLIDDNASCRAYAADELEHSGASVTSVAGYEEALRLLPGQSLIIVDDMSPLLEPQEREAEIRRRLQLPTLPIVLMSFELAVSRFERSGFACVHKPFKPSALLSAALRALQLVTNSAQPRAAALAHDATWATRVPLRILLAEDNPVNQKVAAMMLERLGYQVIVADNGRQAIEAARAGRFDLVLMDVQMPEVDGLQACTEILKLTAAHGYRPRVVALTASVTPEERAAAEAVGMDSFLSKPLRAEELLRVIRSCAQSATYESSDIRSVSR